MPDFQSLRFDYIDYRLVTAGEIRRADIVRTFEVSEGIASQDFTSFQAAHKGAVTYDKIRKCYVPARLPYRPRRKVARAIIDGINNPLGWT